MAKVGLNGVMPFGKFKGKVVHEAILKDARYFCWLRDEQGKEGKPSSFAADVHEVLDAVIDGDKDMRGFKKWASFEASTLDGSIGRDESKVAAVTAVAEEKNLAYAGQWGEW